MLSLARDDQTAVATGGGEVQDTIRKIVIGCTLLATIYLEPLLDYISVMLQDLNSLNTYQQRF
jgi:hypothetical protein